MYSPPAMCPSLYGNNRGGTSVYQLANNYNIGQLFISEEKIDTGMSYCFKICKINKSSELQQDIC